MTWVVDASVAVKWFVEEARSMAARTVLASAEPIIAPDLIVPEVCNTAWKKAQRGEISWAQAEALVQALPLSFEKLVETAPLARAPWSLPGNSITPPTIVFTSRSPTRSRRRW
ncbi:MAG: hypothetical protein KatS3mg123_2962 [Burkholderiales bacterium]|nr:MAG: hypothetical protein KatS3mg123_2962 [Burkholderiales bacterium]